MRGGATDVSETQKRATRKKRLRTTATHNKIQRRNHNSSKIKNAAVSCYIFTSPDDG
jgi:hypothetical protein